MKKTGIYISLLRPVFTALLFGLVMSSFGQDGAIRVKYQGTRPTISDFAEAYFDTYDIDDEEECADEAIRGFHHAWMNHRKGQPQPEGNTLIVDERNGYIRFESNATYEQTTSTVRMEMCYWNESDGKHKLFAYSNWLFINGLPSGGQYDGLEFFRYDNATKKMTSCEAPGFDVNYDMTYALPRTGKDITVTYVRNGKKQQKVLKWNGRKFSF